VILYPLSIRDLLMRRRGGVTGVVGQMHTYRLPIDFQYILTTTKRRLSLVNLQSAITRPKYPTTSYSHSLHYLVKY